MNVNKTRAADDVVLITCIIPLHTRFELEWGVQYITCCLYVISNSSVLQFPSAYSHPIARTISVLSTPSFIGRRTSPGNKGDTYLHRSTRNVIARNTFPSDGEGLLTRFLRRDPFSTSVSFAPNCTTVTRPARLFTYP